MMNHGARRLFCWVSNIIMHARCLVVLASAYHGSSNTVILLDGDAVVGHVLCPFQALLLVRMHVLPDQSPCPAD